MRKKIKLKEIGKRKLKDELGPYEILTIHKRFLYPCVRSRCGIRARYNKNHTEKSRLCRVYGRVHRSGIPVLGK